MNLKFMFSIGYRYVVAFYSSALPLYFVTEGKAKNAASKFNGRLFTISDLL